MDISEYKNNIIKLEKNQDFNGAYLLINEALALYPTNKFLLGNEIYLLVRLNKLTRAHEKADERMELLKYETFFLKTYLTILEKNKRPDKEKDIENFVEKNILANDSRLSKKKDNTNIEELYIYIVNLYHRLFGKQKALEILKTSFGLLPKSVKLKNFLHKWETSEDTIDLKNKYKLYKEKFQDKSATETIQEIEDLRLLSIYKRDSDLLLILAQNYKSLNNYEKIIEIYLNILSIEDNAFAQRMLGYAYYKTGNLPKAYFYLQDIFQKDPFDSYLATTLAKIFQKEFGYQKFRKWIHGLLGKHPDAKHLYGLLKKAKKWKKD